jgi:hypothetical protein
MPKIALTSNNSFASEFLAEYLSHGFGTRSKGELDILVMDLLMKYADLQLKSNQELSILLRASVSKIKRMRYEARLKYPPSENYVRDSFLLILYKSQFLADKNIITFIMEDDYLRYAINGKLKERGHFSDSSFNSEIIKIDRRSLSFVIRELYNEEVQMDFEATFDELLKDPGLSDQERSKLFQTKIADLVVSIAANIGSQFVLRSLGM